MAFYEPALSSCLAAFSNTNYSVCSVSLRAVPEETQLYGGRVALTRTLPYHTGAVALFT